MQINERPKIGEIMYNNRYKDQNDEGQNHQQKRIRNTLSVNTENGKLHLKLSKQNEQLQSSDSTTKELQNKKENSQNRQERWKKKKSKNKQNPKLNTKCSQQLNFKQNSDNRQGGWGGKQIEQNEYSDNTNTEKKIYLSIVLDLNALKSYVLRTLLKLYL